MHVYTNSFYNFAGRNGKSTEPAVVTVDCTYPFSLLLIVVFGVLLAPFTFIICGRGSRCHDVFLLLFFVAVVVLVSYH